MSKLGFSLILKGENYYKKFKNYSIISLKKSLDKINTKKKFLTFYISTEKRLSKKIENLICNYFSSYNYKIFFDYELDKIETIKVNYKLINSIQVKHLVSIRDNKSDYIIFLYSDIIYSANAFYNAFKILNSYKNISTICSFAIALNDNNYFKIFFKKIINNSNYLKFFINKANYLITNFHKKFIYENNIIPNSNCIFILKKKGVLIKSQHYHPIIIKIAKITNINFSSLDSEITKLFDNSNEIYVEKDMKKISIFSFDSSKITRNRIILDNDFKNKLFYKRLALVNIQSNIYNNKFFYNNYTGFSLNKYVKIKSLNNYINHLIKNKIDNLKNNIYKNFKFFFLGKKKIKKIEVFFFIIKNFIYYKIIFRNDIFRNLLNRFYKLGIINKKNNEKKKNLNILNIYLIIFGIFNYKKRILLLLKLLFNVKKL